MELMESIVDKISSYHLFNNFFPGILFCYVVSCTTRFELIKSGWENLFVYYFIGMVISRIGSIVVERLLKLLRVKNKATKEKDPYLKFAPYKDYIEAEQNDSLIPILNETNNTYRTIIAVFIVAVCVKIYDWLLFDFVESLGMIGKNMLWIAGAFLIIFVFVYSYKKQTDFIRNRVEKYMNSKEKNNP